MAKISPVPLISLNLKGVPLGVDKDAVYEEKVMEFRPGDKFVLFTDGLIECESPEGKQWGRKALLEQLGRTTDQSPVEIKDGILKAAYSFYKNVPIKDDITIVVLEIDKTWEAGKITMNPGGGNGEEPVPADNGITSVRVADGAELPNAS